MGRFKWIPPDTFSEVTGSGPPPAGSLIVTDTINPAWISANKYALKLYVDASATGTAATPGAGVSNVEISVRYSVNGGGLYFIVTDPVFGELRKFPTADAPSESETLTIPRAIYTQVLGTVLVSDFRLRTYFEYAVSGTGTGSGTVTVHNWWITFSGSAGVIEG